MTSPPVFGHVIDGEEVVPVGGQYIDTVDPVSGAIVGLTAAGDAEDIDRAVSAASIAFENWREVPLAERAQRIARMIPVLAANLEELLRLEASCTGLPIRRLKSFDLLAVMQFIQLYAEKLQDYRFVEYPPVRNLPEPHHVKIVKHPLGVCGLIPAWNGPLFLSFVKLLPAIAAGNTVVIKPAETASLAVVRAISLLQEVLPPGVVNVVTGLGPRAGEALAAHPSVAKISFTGSVRTGKRVQQVAAESLKRVTLELGGKGPAIVLPDAPIELTARGASFAFLLGAGQICVSGTRLFVDDSLHDALVERMTELAGALQSGSQFSPATTLSPMAFRSHYDRVLGFIEAGKSEGATVVCGGGPLSNGDYPNGLFVQPTIFTDVRPGMRIYEEEIFGPVLSVIRYTELDDAVAMANNSCFGLSAGLWTADPIAAQPVAKRLEAGTVWVNDWHALTTDMSFGGVKQSGYGREISISSMDAYLETRNYMTSFETNAHAKALFGLVHGLG